MTELPYSRDVQIELLLVSPLHRYEGRPADGPLPLPGNAGDERRERIDIRAHLGVVGDRYFGGKAHVREAVTVMAAESLDAITAELGLPTVPDAALTRRNIIVRGVDIDALRPPARAGHPTVDPRSGAAARRAAARSRRRG